jgi:hypothetical protein
MPYKKGMVGEFKLTSQRSRAIHGRMAAVVREGQKMTDGFGLQFNVPNRTNPFRKQHQHDRGMDRRGDFDVATNSDNPYANSWEYDFDFREADDHKWKKNWQVCSLNQPVTVVINDQHGWYGILAEA